MAIKNQAVVDFIVELTSNEEGEVSSNPSSVTKKSLMAICLALMWDLHVDGSLSSSGCGASLVLISPELECLRIEYALRLGFKTSNNEAKYEVLLANLRLVQVVGSKHFHIFNDSQLVAW